MRAILLVFCFFLTNLLTSSQEEPCNLSYTQIFNPLCEDLLLDHPEVIYLNQSFKLSYACCAVPESVAVFSLTSANAFCGADGYVNGSICSHTIVDVSSTVVSSSITCSGGPPSPVAGNSSLILTLENVTGIMSCNVIVPVKWGQTVSIYINQEDVLAPINVTDQQYFIFDSSISVTISCIAVPGGIPPMLTYSPFTTSSITSLPVYQNSSAAYIEFPGGFTPVVSGIYTCTSASGYSVTSYIANPPSSGLPVMYFANGSSISSVVGSPLVITAYILSDAPLDVSGISFQPLSGEPSSTPQLSLEDGVKLTVTYDHISVPPTPLHQLCVEMMGSGSAFGMMDIYYSETCSETITLSITVPVLEISTSLLVSTVEGFVNGTVNVTCTPSDPSAIVFWRNRAKLPLESVYPTYQFLPTGLNHTVVVVSPPNGIEEFTCGLYNGEGAMNLLSSVNATVVSISRPVSVFNNGGELLNNAVINSFLLLNSNPYLSLRCFSLQGHGNLEWETRNVSALPDNLTEMTVSSEQDLTVVTYGRDTTLNYTNFSPERSGYYSCRSAESEEKFELFTTFVDPYWELLSPPIQYAAVGTTVTLLSQYASVSKGYGNDGPSFLLGLRYVSFNEMATPIVSDQPSEKLTYQLEYMFAVNSSSQGTYQFSASIGEQYFSGSSTVHASVPQFTEVSTPVYALLKRAVYLTCVPNDTAVPVTWSINNFEGYSPLPLEDPDFEYDPPTIRNEISFNLESTVLASYGYDVDSTSISLVKFQCGFVDLNPNSLVGASTIFLYIQFETIEVLSLTVYQNLVNNTIVNYFPLSSKRNLAIGDYFSARCTTVQGDHDPLWKVTLFGKPGQDIVLNSSYSEGLYATHINSYQNELTVYVNSDHDGVYTCQSSVSGVQLTFTLVSENPFVKAMSANLTAFLGEDVTLSFLAAEDSTGIGNNIVNSVQIYHNTTNATVVPLGEAIPNCPDEQLECFTYWYQLRNVKPAHSGIYIARVISIDCEIPNSPFCQYAQDTVSLAIKIPDLIPISNEVELIAGIPLHLFCTPSPELSSYYIEWKYNGELITGFTPESKRAAPQAYFYPPSTKSSIYLYTTSPEESGTYTCTLFYDETEITSQNIQVTITPAPPPISCFSEYDELCTGDVLGQVSTVEECCLELNGEGYALFVPDYFYYYYEEGGLFLDEYSYYYPLCTSCLEAIPRCPRQLNGGVLWEETYPSTTVSIKCSDAGPQFNKGPFLTRKCFEPGIWGPVDFSQCTLTADLTGNLGLLSMVVTGVTLNEIEGNRTNLETEMRSTLDSNNVTYTSVAITAISSASVAISFLIDYSPENNLQFMAVVSMIQVNKEFGGYSVQTAIVSVIESTDSCPCQQYSGVLMPEEEPLEAVISLCAGSITSPCNCVNQTCMCQTPFVGNGKACTLDSDGDLYPDIPLSTCGNSTETYCIQDNCQFVYNADQDSTACQTVPEFQGCEHETDQVWWVTWSNTEPGYTDTQPCPGGVDVMGSATRYCNSDGVWQEPNVINCVPVIFNILDNQANDLFNNENLTLQEQLNDITQVTTELVVATSVEDGQPSLLPSALNTTIKIVTGVVDLLEQSLQNDSIVVDLDQLGIIDILDNCLDVNHANGWTDLQRADIEGTSDSNNFLQDTERYGLYLAQSTGNTLQTRRNIALKAEQVLVTSDESLVFPQADDLEGSSIPRSAAQVSIPPELLTDRANDGKVPVVSVLFQHLEVFLATADFNFSNTTVPGSIVWSGQVSLMRTSTDVPINLTFAVDTVENASSYLCVYWDTTTNGGGWSTAGVRTVSNATDKNGNVSVRCQSNHLTAFAVLVDVSGEVRNFNPIHLKALQIVSYIGCAISILCLVLAVIFFAAKGKQLLSSVHFLVHLNLCLSLLFGYFVFVVGVETAKNSTGGCAFVAALLHYFFLASFCWMLCEGIMLYLMLVVVFTSIAKKFYLFLIVGWATPLVPVVIGLAAAHEYYGVRDESGELQFCWLSVEGGAIWAFVAPMLLIIVVNIVFLVLALRSIWKTKGSRRAQNLKKSDKSNKRQLAIDIFKASLILLPLLGATWLFGLLTVNENTAVFAWLFTICNSLQGAAVFFLHVVKNDKVWSRVSPHLKSLKNRTLRSNVKSSYSMSNQSTLVKQSAYWMKRNEDGELHVEISETKQDFSSSDPEFDNPAYEMESIVIKNAAKAAEDDGNLSEQQNNPLHTEQEQVEEKEVRKVDLSNQEEQAVDMKDEQHQGNLCSADDYCKSGQSFQNEACKGSHLSSSDHSKTDHTSECNDFKGDNLPLDAGNTDLEKIPKEIHDEEGSSDNGMISHQKKSGSLLDKEKVEESEEHKL